MVSVNADSWQDDSSLETTRPVPPIGNHLSPRRLSRKGVPRADIAVCDCQISLDGAKLQRRKHAPSVQSVNARKVQQTARIDHETGDRLRDLTEAIRAAERARGSFVLRFSHRMPTLMFGS